MPGLVPTTGAATLTGTGPDCAPFALEVNVMVHAELVSSKAVMSNVAVDAAIGGCGAGELAGGSPTTASAVLQTVSSAAVKYVPAGAFA